VWVRPRRRMEHRKGEGRALGRELKFNILWRSGGAVFDAEQQAARVAPQVKIRIAPTVEVRGSAQRLTGSLFASAFSSVMDQEYGQMKLALEFSPMALTRTEPLSLM